jgi:hypothetical protein
MTYGLAHRIYQRRQADQTVNNYKHFSWHLHRADSNFYESIAKNGYLYPGLSGADILDGKTNQLIDSSYASANVKNNNVGFFPLYPYLARLLYSLFNIDVRWSLTAVSWLFSLLFWYTLFSRPMRLSFGNETVVWSALFVFFFPSSFFLLANYTESLLAFLMIFILKDFVGLGDSSNNKRINFTVASRLGILGLAKATVLPLTAVVWLCSIRKYKIINQLKWIAVALSGFLIFLIYCAIFFKDPFLYFKIQKYSWPQSDSGLLSLLNIDRLVGTIFDGKTCANGIIGFGSLLVSLGGVSSHKLPIKRAGILAVSVLVLVLAGTVNNYMNSCLRYVLMATPVFLIMGHFMASLRNMWSKYLAGLLLLYAGFFWFKNWLEIFIANDFFA